MWYGVLPWWSLRYATPYGSYRKLSLSKRLMIAVALAETILQIHTTGWLHKEPRFDNVVFLTLGDCRWDNGTALGPYLAGYEHARSSTAETKTTPGRPEGELYSHPLAQRPSRSNFRGTFDIFALGCVLLEAALWKVLRDILRQASTPVNSPRMSSKPSSKHRKACDSSQWAHINNAKARMLDDRHGTDLADVAFHAGETFKEVIVYACARQRRSRGR